MFKNLSIRNRLMLYISSVALVAFAITITYVATKASNMSKTQAFDEVEQTALRYSKEIQGEIEQAINATRTMADMFKGYKQSGQLPDRTICDSMLKSVVENNPDFLGTWSCWEPDALDGKDSEFTDKPNHDSTGRYIPYWCRDAENNVVCEALVDYNTPGNGDYYLLARNSGNETILDPFIYNVAGRDVLMTSVVTPIIIDNKVLGVTGVDIALDRIYQETKEIKLYQTGYISVIANNGTYVAHPDPKRIGNEVIKTDPWIEPFLTDIKTGSGFTTSNFSTIVNAKVYRRSVPMQLGQTKTPWTILASIPTNKITENARNITYATIVIGIISLGALIVIVFFIARGITGPVNLIVANIKDIAQGEGDLTKRLPVKSGDEIGELAKWFNTFVEKLQDIIRQIANNTQILASASTELSSTASTLAGTAEETTNQSYTVSAASEELSTNMNNMSASSEEMTANVKTVAAAIEEMTASITEVAKNAEQASQVAAQAAGLSETSNQKISELGVAADEIGKVIEVIQDIAEQTNLLALNATIEAARAGDAGKGFAVVATEVKELAKQTALATEDISKRIAAIQTTSGDSVESISKISEVIKNVNAVSTSIASAVEEQSITTREIAQNVTQVATACETVTRGVTDSATASHEITRTIAGVDAAAKHTATGAAQTQTAGTELSKLSEELKSLVDQFKI